MMRNKLKILCSCLLLSGLLSFSPTINAAPGDLDGTITRDGKLYDFLDNGGNDYVFGTAIQVDGIDCRDRIDSNGRAVVVGEASENIAIARVLGDFIPSAKVPFDFDGDRRSDVSVFPPSNAAWYINQSADGFTGLQFGSDTDKIVPADYDGDGKADVAVFRGGTWYPNRTSAGFIGVSFGSTGDLPIPNAFVR